MSKFLSWLRQPAYLGTNRLYPALMNYKESPLKVMNRSKWGLALLRTWVRRWFFHLAFKRSFQNVPSLYNVIINKKICVQGAATIKSHWSFKKLLVLMHNLHGPQTYNRSPYKSPPPILLFRYSSGSKLKTCYHKAHKASTLLLFIGKVLPLTHTG